MNARSILAALLALTFCACGGGVGGTGNGGEGAPASSDSVCKAPFAILLACPGGSADAGGTARAAFADAVPIAHAGAVFEGNHADFGSGCPTLAFGGDWVAGGSPPARFHGTATVGGATVPATMAVQAAGGSLVVQVFDAAGHALGDALALQPAAAPVTPAPCGAR